MIKKRRKKIIKKVWFEMKKALTFATRTTGNGDEIRDWK
jgi:hypothetical protein